MHFIDKLSRRRRRKSSARARYTSRNRRGTRYTRLRGEILEERLLLFTLAPTWLETGPNAIATTRDWQWGGGAIESIATHPTDPRTVLVGAANGGIWRTRDVFSATPNWEPLTDYQESLSIGSIAFSPVNADVLYAGTAESTELASGTAGGGGGVGILRSVDGGDNWQLLGANIFAGESIRSIIPTAFDAGGRLLGPDAPASEQVVLAATWSWHTPESGGVYRSTNGGVSWSRLSGLPGSGLPDGGASDLVADPLNSQRLFAALVGQGVFTTADGGTTWSPVNNHVGDAAVVDGLTLRTDGFDNDQDGNDADRDGDLDTDDVLLVGDANSDGFLTLADINVDESDEGVDTADRIELAYHHSAQGSAVYAALISDARLGVDGAGEYTTDSWRLRALFRSDDDGQTWRQASNFQQTNLGDGDGQYYFAMAAVPDEPNRVVVRGTTQGYWVTFDPSIATQNDSWQSLEYSRRPHPNARDFAFTAPTAEVPSLLLD